MIKKIATIGLGYIGTCTSLFFAKKGIEIIGIDLDTKKIETLRCGKVPIKELYLWLTFDPEPLVKNNMSFYDNFDILDKEIVDAIFVAIPTEKNGEPYFDILKSVVSKIAKSKNKNTLVIIESTLMPGISDKYIKPYLPNFAVAPRRDWLGFEEPGRTLERLPRIVGGKTPEITEKTKEILSIVSKELHGCLYSEAELVKAVENGIRHIGSVYAQELAWAYPELDVNNILRLASTKWNVPFYYPNIFGSSGYCLRGNEFIVAKIDGLISFITLEKLYEQKDKSIEVLSYNELKKIVEFSKVINFSTRESETITFKMKGNNRITVTPDHIMYIKSVGLWKRLAKDIREGDVLPFIDDFKKRETSFLPMNYNLPPYIVQIDEKYYLDMKYFLDGTNEYNIIHKKSLYYLNILDFKGFKNPLPEFIKINPEFAEVLGLFAAEGCVTGDRGIKDRTFFSLGRKEINQVNKIKDFLIKINVRFTISEDKNCETTHIRVSSKEFGKMMSTLIGTNSFDVKFPEFLMFYPCSKTKDSIIFSLLKGFINGEGYVDKKGNHWEVFSSSKILIQQVIYLLRNYGLKPCLKKGEEYSNIRCFGNKSRKFGLNLFVDKKLDRIVNKIKSIHAVNTDSDSEYVEEILNNSKEIVYSIEVDGNHNFFTTNGLLVHNCIPLANYYVLSGSKENDDKLSICKSAIVSDNFTATRIYNLLKPLDIKSIGILGMAYLGNIKVHVLAGALRLLKAMDKNMKSKVKLQDPFYTEEEIKNITGCNNFTCPEDLDKFEVLIVTAGHDFYTRIPKKVLIEKTKKARFILDNTGIWKDIPFKCKYILPGNSGWLKKIV